VDGTDEHLTVRDIVLLIIDAAGGVVEGRTALQKLSYFAGLEIDEDLGHHAHYYGPYSRPVESALNNSAFAGELDEVAERFSSWSGPDIYKYTYTLTDEGKQEVASLRSRFPDLNSKVERVVQRLAKLVPGFSQHPLSLAAKVDYIARREHATISATEIPDRAQRLGWEVSEPDVEKAVEILVGLGHAPAPSG
jgi:uncharacterized protein YwgA